MYKKKKRSFFQFRGLTFLNIDKGGGGREQIKVGMGCRIYYMNVRYSPIFIIFFNTINHIPNIVSENWW